LYLAISYWDIALPTVTIHYSENGREELRYIWNVQDRIYKGGMQPGGGTVDNGFLFPDDNFLWRSLGGAKVFVPTAST
jgi:hypothetical protein